MTNKRRILLVDDEPRVVDGLQRYLRRYRDIWDVTTANSAHAALAKMETTVFDVIVTDMRMPQMDGATFLAIAKAMSPATMRIVLSGQTDPEAALRAVPVAHQFLSKPTDPAVLFEQILRLAASHDAISDPRVRAALGGVDSLPSALGTYQELGRLLADESVSVRAIARVVDGEPAIAIKVLQLVNSAFFRVSRRILDVSEAISYLGTELVRGLVLSVGVVSGLPVRAARFDADAFYAHALTVARMARHIDAGGERSNVSFVAALLHDVGQLVMAATLPDLFDEGTAADNLGCSQAQVGAALLDLWGLPYPIVEAMLTFEDARATATSELRAVDVVYLAHRLVDPETDDFASEEDQTYLQRFASSVELTRWQAHAGLLKGAA